MSGVPVAGKSFRFDFGANAKYDLSFTDPTHLAVTVVEDAHYAPGTINYFEIDMTEVRPDLYQITWVEPDTGNTVTHVDDFAAGRAWTNITDIATRGFWRLAGTITPLTEA